MRIRKVIYICGPMSKGDRILNFSEGLRTYKYLVKYGFAPICPMISFLVADILDDEIDYETWLEVDFGRVSRCHALLRLPGESSGADREVAVARGLGIPVYFDMASLLQNEKWDEE